MCQIIDPVINMKYSFLLIFSKIDQCEADKALKISCLIFFDILIH